MLASLLAGALPVKADEFVPRVEFANHELTKRGETSFHWLWFHLYDAALYMPSDSSAEDVFEPIPRQLELVYRRTIPVEKIVEAGDRLLAKNTPPEILDELRPTIERFNAAYREPSAGDRYRLRYSPERGTELYFNDTLLASADNPKFAAYYFRIWLGEHPVSTEFRDALLGRG